MVNLNSLVIFQIITGFFKRYKARGVRDEKNKKPIEQFVLSAFELLKQYYYLF